MDNILSQTNIPVEFDLLSIGIDGNDYHVWDSLVRYSPKVVVIEFNPSIPSDVEFVQKKDYSLNHGNSLLSLINLGKLKGYEIIATTACNGFFVRKELFERFEIEDNSINYVWDNESKAPRVFQLYNGTLALTDEFKLIWSNNKVKKFDLQKLPSYLRGFDDTTNKRRSYHHLIKKIYRKFPFKRKEIDINGVAK